jgi:hypothetical protein
MSIIPGKRILTNVADCFDTKRFRNDKTFCNHLVCFSDSDYADKLRKLSILFPGIAERQVSAFLNKTCGNIAEACRLLQQFDQEKNKIIKEFACGLVDKLQNTDKNQNLIDSINIFNQFYNVITQESPENMTDQIINLEIQSIPKKPQENQLKNQIETLKNKYSMLKLHLKSHKYNT